MIMLIIGLAVLGVCLYLLQQIPMDPTILIIIRVVVILCAILYLLRLVGFVDIPVPRVR